MLRLCTAAMLFASTCVVSAAPLSATEFRRLSKDVAKASKAGDWERARAAVGELAGEDAQRTPLALAKLVAKSAHSPLYSIVRDALAGLASPDAVGELGVVMTDGRLQPASKLVVIDACAERSDDVSGRALSGALDDKRPEVRRAAVRALRAREAEWAVGALIALLGREEAKDKTVLNAAAAREALVAITGQQLHSADQWAAWHAASSKADRPVTGGDEEPTHTRTRPRFFGTEIVSNNLVFVIDVSTSMENEDTEPDPDAQPRRPTTGGGVGAGAPAKTSGSRVRIERAKFQLALAIRSLGPRTKFSVVAYSGYLIDGRSMAEGFHFPAEVPEQGELPDLIGGVYWLQVWRRKPVAASTGAKKSAVEFVGTLRPQGSTFTLRALRVALAMPGVEEIVLLSDGSPTEIDGRTAEALLTADEILERVDALNRLKRVRINTFGVGIEDEDAFGVFLRDLAGRNGGTFTDVR